MKRTFDVLDVLKVIIIAISVVILFVSVIFRPINLAVNEREVVVTVTDKGIKTSGKSSKYLIYAQDESGNPQVFQITDNLWRFRFDSADIYAQIKENTTYAFTVCGSRIRMFSWFPNIYDFEVITDNNGKEVD